MNLRVMITGALMIGLALAFFYGMASATAPKSNDPAAMTQTVGMDSGGVGGLGVAMVIFGALRRKR
jgi:hypothetical protein